MIKTILFGILAVWIRPTLRTYILTLAAFWLTLLIGAAFALIMPLDWLRATMALVWLLGVAVVVTHNRIPTPWK